MEVNTPLKDTLCEVRKAYRLIAAYQRRILDMAKTIQKSFDYKPYYYVNNEYDIRGRSSLPTDRWSLDMLPLYMGCSMLYLPQKADSNYPKKDEWMLKIRFDNDTGFKREKGREPDVREFEDAEKCESRLWLYAFGVLTDLEKTNWLGNVYSKIDWHKDGGSITKNNIWAVGKYYDLSIILDEEVLKEVIDDFEKFIGEQHTEILGHDT